MMWLLHGYAFITNWELGDYGILPRSIEGVSGILTGPLIHASVQHLLSNSVPLVVLASLIIYFYRSVSAQILLLIYFLTDILVFLCARPAFHIGASGIVYGLFGFLIGIGFFQRNVKSIILAFLVITFYGSLVWGVLPGQPSVSWESHLIGVLTGVMVSYWYRNNQEPDDDMTMGNTPLFHQHQTQNANEDETRDFFLPRDVFSGLRPKYTPPPPEPEWNFIQYNENYNAENYTQNHNENQNHTENIIENQIENAESTVFVIKNNDFNDNNTNIDINNINNQNDNDDDDDAPPEPILLPRNPPPPPAGGTGWTSTVSW